MNLRINVDHAAERLRQNMWRMCVPIAVCLILITAHSTVGATSCKPFCNVPGPWISQATNVCYGAKDESFGTFYIQTTCQLHAIRLSHVSGNVSCKIEKPSWAAYWGCNTDCCETTGCPGRGCFSTTIIHQKDRTGWAFGFAYLYEFPGFHIYDDAIYTRKSANVTQGDAFRIAYGFDLFDRPTEDKSGGRHCVDVDISCLQ